MRPRRGFSYIELLVVLTVIGIVTRIAIPRMWDVRKRAQSRAAVADVRVIRDALLSHQTDRGAYPGESPSGMIPSGLQSFLPTGFAFTREDYTLNYEYWAASGPSPAVIGVAVETADSTLANEVRKLGASGLPHLLVGTRTVFILSGLDGVS